MTETACGRTTMISFAARRAVCSGFLLLSVFATATTAATAEGTGGALPPATGPAEAEAPQSEHRIGRKLADRGQDSKHDMRPARRAGTPALEGDHRGPLAVGRNYGGRGESEEEDGRRVREGAEDDEEEVDPDDLDSTHLRLRRYPTEDNAFVGIEELGLNLDHLPGDHEQYEFHVYSAGALYGRSGDVSNVPGQKGARPPPGISAQERRVWWRRHKNILARRRERRQRRKKEAEAAAAAEGRDQQQQPSGGGVEKGQDKKQNQGGGQLDLQIIIVQDTRTVYETFDLDIEVLCAQSADGTLSNDRQRKIENAIRRHLQETASCAGSDAVYEHVSLVDFFDSDCCVKFGGDERKVDKTCALNDVRGRKLQTASFEFSDPSFVISGGGDALIGDTSLSKTTPAAPAAAATTTTAKKKRTSRRRRSRARLKRKYRCRRCPTNPQKVLVADSELIPDRRLGADADGFLRDVVGEAMPDSVPSSSSYLRASSSSAALPSTEQDAPEESTLADETAYDILPSPPHEHHRRNQECEAITLVDALRAEGLDAVHESEITAVYRHDCSPRSDACLYTGFCCSAPGCACTSDSGINAEMCRRSECVLPRPAEDDDGNVIGKRPDLNENLCCSKSTATEIGAGLWRTNVQAFPGQCGTERPGSAPDVCGTDLCALQPNVVRRGGEGPLVKEVDVTVEVANVCSKDNTNTLVDSFFPPLRKALASGDCGGDPGKSFLELRNCNLRKIEDGTQCDGGQYVGTMGKEASLVTLSCRVDCRGGYCLDDDPVGPLGPFCWGPCDDRRLIQV